MSDEVTAPGQEPLEELLRRVPFFSTLDRVDVARLVGAVEELAVPAGTELFREGDPGDALYLVERGTVQIAIRTEDGERQLGLVVAPGHFGELGLLLERRTSTARTLSDVRMWKLPRHRFAQLARERPALGLAIATSLAGLIETRQRALAGAPAPPPAGRPLVVDSAPPAVPGRRRLVGAAVALSLPLALWNVAPPIGLEHEAWRVVLILAGAAVAWLAEPLPDFVVALLMVTAWGVAGLVPLSTAFAGFTSQSWVVALGALALAAAMARSGLLFRLALLLLRTFPATHVGQVLALVVGGVLVTPLVPLATARIASVAPLTRELAEALDYQRRSAASAALAFAGLVGYGSFSAMFLTGLAMNFFVVGLLPADEAARFGWLAWSGASAVTGLVALVLLVAALLALFPADRSRRLAAEVLERQDRALGPLSRQERVAIGGVAVLLVGLLLQPVIRIDTSWLAVGALGVVVAGGLVDRERFRTSIDWGFLVLFGLLLGTGDALRSVGVDRWIADSLLPLTQTIRDDAILILLLAGLVVAARLVLPRQPAILLLCLALVPAAGRLGLEPWLVGFVILFVGQSWVHPSQSDFYRILRDSTRGELFTDRQGLVLGVALTAASLLAVAMSIPYWDAIGLLRE